MNKLEVISVIISHSRFDRERREKSFVPNVEMTFVKKVESLGLGEFRIRIRKKNSRDADVRAARIIREIELRASVCSIMQIPSF